MQSLIKKFTPHFLKFWFWQKYLNIKFSKQNYLGRRIVFSKDTIIGKQCKIGNDAILGKYIIIGDNVTIGNGAIIENLQIDNNSCIESKVICTGYGTGKIKIGQNSYIGLYNILDWSNDITIGDFVHIAGPSTGLWTHSSAKMCLNSIPLNNKSEEFRPTAPIIIESNVYIGGNCTIYPGVTIGHHSIVVPNSVVAKKVGPYSMVGGVPAKFIKTLQPNS